MNDSPIRLPPLQCGKPEITMAPMVDVVFLLLIFFMVTTVFPENQGLVIERPVSEQAEQLTTKKINFTLSPEGEFYFQDKKINAADVTRILKERLAMNPDLAVILLTDRRADTGALIKLMDACKAGGAEQIGIATDVEQAAQR